MKISTTFLSIIAFIFSLFSYAQSDAKIDYEKGFRLGFGLNMGPVFEKSYQFGLGADARIQYDISKETSLTFTTGFTNLFISDDLKDLGFIPAKVGFKGFVIGDSFYLMGEVGAAFAVTNSYDKTSFLAAPSIGYANKFVDLSLRYEYYTDFPKVNGDKGVGQLALRIAYGFKL